MVKFTKLETYYPNSKLVTLLELVTHTKPTIINGMARVIDKTNIKQICPVIYQSKSNNIIIYEYQTSDLKGRTFYLPTLNETYNFKELQKVLQNLM